MRARIILVASHAVFMELALMIKYALHHYGVDDVVIEDDTKVNFNELKCNFNFVIKAFRPFPHGSLKSGQKILVQVEELWNRRERGHYDLSAGFDKVLEMYDENVKIPAGTENVVYCPIGYSPIWEYDLPEVEEDIDVLFHGSITPRRDQFYASLINDLQLKNVMFTNQLYGEERAKTIMRSKIVVNIKAHDRWSYGPLHCLPTQAQKKFMLTEKADGGYGPFIPGIHIAEYDGIDDFKAQIMYWLDHENERKEFGLTAYNDMVKTCDYTPIFGKAMGFI